MTFGPPVTTRLPFAVHLMAVMCTCWWGDAESASLIRPHTSVGLGLKVWTDLDWARSRMMLTFLGLDLAIAE